jgi:hypothetical protein
MRRLWLVAALVPALAGCGGGGDAAPILSRTAANLGKIHSGRLDLRFLVTPREGNGRVGFELHGPFALRRGLPLARVDYTQITGERSATATLVSTGERAYVELGGRAYELPGATAAQLASAAGGVSGSQGLGELRIDGWVKDPHASDGGDVGGAATDHVSSGLDVVRAANDLLALVRRLGRDAPALRGRDAQQLRDAVRSSHLDVWTGKDDRLLRRLRLDADFGFDVPESLRRSLGDVVGGKFEFELGIANPNEPVHVSAPAHPLPASQLPRG